MTNLEKAVEFWQLAKNRTVIVNGFHTKNLDDIIIGIIHGDRVITDIVDDVLIATWLDTSYIKGE